MLFLDEEEAIECLKKLGYRVQKIEEIKGKDITKLPELLLFFYSVRDRYRGNHNHPPSVDLQGDRNSLKLLLDARQRLGISRKRAFQECALLIEALFKYEKVLKLGSPITNAALLKSNTLVNRLCALLNGEDLEGAELDNLEAQNEWELYYNQNYFDRDIEKINRTREVILERLYGKEK